MAPTLILILIILISIIIFLKITAKTSEKLTVELPSTHLDLWEVPVDTAPANIDNARPYVALDKPIAPNQILSTMTAKQCSETNPVPVLGNYNQSTNNCKHVSPDSCSAPRQELVGSFYAA
jgi:hypothetical protein